MQASRTKFFKSYYNTKVRPDFQSGAPSQIEAKSDGLAKPALVDNGCVSGWRIGFVMRQSSVPADSTGHRVAGTYMSMKLLLLSAGENHDTVPVVVLRERLDIATLSYYLDAAR